MPNPGSTVDTLCHASDSVGLLESAAVYEKLATTQSQSVSGSYPVCPTVSLKGTSRHQLHCPGAIAVIT